MIRRPQRYERTDPHPGDWANFAMAVIVAIWLLADSIGGFLQ